jgi:hypothetical protein
MPSTSKIASNHETCKVRMKAFLLALVGSAHFSTCDGFVNNRFPLNKALFSTTDTVDAEIVDKEIEIDTTSKLKVPNTSW